jgi:predicted TIM-barrel fold metal-dependent hydrolase
MHIMHVKRSQLLAGLAGAGVMCASGPPAIAAGRRIDVHHHYFPPAYKEAGARLGRRDIYGSSPARLSTWGPEQSLATMDRVGVERALLSLSTPGVFGDVTGARELARACNEYGAELRRRYPGRFGIFAALPLPDVEGSLAEIRYSLDVLKLEGIGVLTSYGTRWLGDATFEPVIAELDRRAAVVFVHPTVADCCGTILPGVSPSIEEFPFDTTRAITSLFYGGLIAKYPNVRYIFSHSGGALPSIAPRLAKLAGPAVEARLPRGFAYEFRKLYFDVAIGSAPGQLAGLLATAAPDRVLFGTDTPFVGTEATVPDFEGAAISAALRQAIETTNALALFPQFRTPAA